ncbi:MAG: cyclase family protein [Sphingomicrobium sp.]
MDKTRLFDLSHVIEEGMTTYKGLPGPHLCDFWSREASAANYDDGSSFQIGRIDMVANTGTYVDAPFHRYEDGKDLAALPIGSLADLPGIVVRRPFAAGLPTGAEHFLGLDLRGKAVLVHTGWTVTGEPTHIRKGIRS